MIWEWLLSWLGIEVETLTHQEALGVILAQHSGEISTEWVEDPDMLGF